MFVKGQCPNSDWTLYGGDCYLLASEEAKTYQEAVEICRGEYQHSSLPIVKTNHLQQWLGKSYFLLRRLNVAWWSFLHLVTSLTKCIVIVSGENTGVYRVCVCVCVCLSVCACVCLFRAVWRNYFAFQFWVIWLKPDVMAAILKNEKIFNF